jgi:hypothetical protein
MSLNAPNKPAGDEQLREAIAEFKRITSGLTLTWVERWCLFEIILRRIVKRDARH